MGCGASSDNKKDKKGRSKKDKKEKKEKDKDKKGDGEKEKDRSKDKSRDTAKSPKPSPEPESKYKPGDNGGQKNGGQAGGADDDRKRIAEGVTQLLLKVLGAPRHRRGSPAGRRSLQMSQSQSTPTKEVRSGRGALVSPVREKSMDHETARERMLAAQVLAETCAMLSTRFGQSEVLRELHQWEEKRNTVESDDEGEHDSTPAPEGTVAFVFTDIASSTMLWEQVPEAMDEALSNHNKVMRRALRSCSGYEVKTIGDAFMVAFAEAVDAVRFGLVVQAGLVEQDWPDELQEVSAAAYLEDDSGQVIYQGLRVRMGCHVGEVIKEVNPITGRADYRGPTVNVAARVEGQGVGGQVFITNEVLAAIESELTALGDPVVRPVGTRTLKGVAKPVELYSTVPSHLSGRLAPAKEEAKPSEEKGVANFHSQLFSGLGKQLGMKMRRATGTLCVVRPDAPDDLATSTPDEVLDAQCSLIRTAVMDVAKVEGQLEGVQGDSILAAWNTTRACMAHTEQSLRFAALAYARRNPNVADLGFGAAFGACPVRLSPRQKKPGDQLLFGICVGKLMQGTVGTARQRFRIILGHCERLAGALSDHCPMFGCMCLVSRRPRKTSAGSDGIEAHLRPVDIWQVGTEPCAVIEEANLITLSKTEQEFGVWDFLADDTAAGMGGGEATATHTKQKVKRTLVSGDAGLYFDSFHAAIRGDEQALQSLCKLSEAQAAKGPPDVGLQLTCIRLRQHLKSGKASAEHPARYELPSLMPFAMPAEPLGRTSSSG